MNKEQLKNVIEEIVAQVLTEQNAGSVSAKPNAGSSSQGTQNYDVNGEVRDLSAVNYREIIDVPNAYNLEEFKRMRRETSARVGVWRTGVRYRTNTYLRFCSDHSVAMDAVFNDVDAGLIEDLKLPVFKTLCDSKDTYLTRPDLGRLFSDEVAAEIKNTCPKNPDVQIIVADGLSSTAVEANMKDLLPSLLQGLDMLKINVGKPIFVKYGRVRAMDAVTEILGSKVTVILLGERPGLGTAESLSAYITYGGFIGISEMMRTVISNIHKGGTNPTEAGAFIAELCQRMLKEKASGLDLKL